MASVPRQAMELTTAGFPQQLDHGKVVTFRKQHPRGEAAGRLWQGIVRRVTEGSR
jgi:hypothetical protein